MQRTVSDARIELVSGEDAGLVALTDAGGRFALTGRSDASNQITLRVSKPGFDTTDDRFTPFVATNTRSITLASSALLNMSGNYTLQITADASCGIPGEYRTRSYTADIRPSASPGVFTMQVGGAEFLKPYAGYETTGRVVVSDDLAVFDVWADAVVDTYFFIEMLMAGAFWFGGTASVPLNGAPDFLDAPLDGFISYCPTMVPGAIAGFNCGPDSVGCPSSSHRMTLMRR